MSERESMTCLKCDIGDPVACVWVGEYGCLRGWADALVRREHPEAEARIAALIAAGDGLWGDLGDCMREVESKGYLKPYVRDAYNRSRAAWEQAKEETAGWGGFSC